MTYPSPPYFFTSADLANAKTLTAPEKTYLSQLIGSGADLVTGLYKNNGFTIRNNPVTNPNGPFSYTICTPQNTCNGSFSFDYIKAWFAANNIDFDTALVQQLQNIGINVNYNVGTITSTTINTNTSFATLVSACITAIASGNGIPAAFTAMANSFDFGYTANQIDAFVANANNAIAIQQAVQMMNYPVPTTDDTNGQNQFEQIYWAAYYLVQYPLKSSYSATDCETILETNKALAAEKTNISASNAGQFYSTYTQNDYSLRLTALTDLSSIFNVLDAKYNCTANAAAQLNAEANASINSGAVTSTSSSSGNNTLWYVLGGIFFLTCVVIIVKKYKSKHAPDVATKTSASKGEDIKKTEIIDNKSVE